MAEQTISTELRLNAAQFIAEAEKAASAARKVVSESEKGTPTATSGWEKFSKAVTNNRQAMTTLGAGMAGVGAVMLGVTGKVASTGIAFNNLEQTSRAALTSLLGSAKAANNQMDELGEFVKKSPFAKDMFIEAQQQLLGFGVQAQKVIPYLDAIQNAVAATGGSNQQILELSYIFGKISSSSKITAVDLMQFGKRGVDAAAVIGSAMGKTSGQIRSEIRAGTLDADAALDALAQGMMKKFDGAAAGVKETFAGALQRVGAAFRDFSSSAMDPFVGKEGGGLFVDLLNRVADLIRYMDKLPGPVKTAVVSIGAIGGAALTAGGAFLMLAPRIVETASALGTLKDAGIPVISTLARVVSSVGRLGPVLGVAAGALAVVGVGFTVAANKSADAAARTEQYASVLKSVGGSAGDTEKALRNTTREMVAANKLDWGGWQKFQTGVATLPDALDRAGVSINQFVDGVHGSDAEFEAFIEHLKHLQSELSRDDMDGKVMFSEIITKANQARNSVLDAQKANDAYAESAEAAGDSGEAAAAALEAEAEAAAAAQAAVDSYRSALRALVEYQNAQANAANAAINAEREWINARNALTESIQENGSTLDQNTEAGQKNMQAWQDLIAKSSEYVQTAIENGDSADVVAAKWDEAKGVLAELGVQLDTGGEEALEMAHRLGFLTDSDYEFFLKMHAEEAEAELAALEEQLHGLPRETLVSILAQDNASDIIALVDAALEADVPPEVITEIMANDQVSDKAAAIQARIQKIPLEWHTGLKATDMTSAPAGIAKRSVEEIPPDWHTRLTTDDQTSGKGRSAAGSVKGVLTSRHTTLNATDNVSPVVGWIQRAMNGLTDKTVTIRTNYITTNSGSAKNMGQQVPGAATGGAIFGPGSWTSDSILARLSNYEHVMTGREVWNLGGHGNVYALRRMIRENPRDVRAALGFAAGGTPAGAAHASVLPRVAAAAAPTVVIPPPVVQPDVHVTAVVENPFTGEEVDARVKRTVVEFGGGR